MDKLNPIKSSKTYDAKWSYFYVIAKIQENEDLKEKEHFFKHFHHLRETENMLAFFCGQVFNGQPQVSIFVWSQLSKIFLIEVALEKIRGWLSTKTASLFTREKKLCAF